MSRFTRRGALSLLSAGSAALAVPAVAKSAPRLSPDERVAAALAEMKAALAEKWAGCRMQDKSQEIHAIAYDEGRYTPLPPHGELIMIYVSAEQRGEEMVHWSVGRVYRE